MQKFIRQNLFINLIQKRGQNKRKIEGERDNYTEEMQINQQHKNCCWEIFR